MTFVFVQVTALHRGIESLLVRLGLLMSTLPWLLVQTNIYFLFRVKALILDQETFLLPLVCFLFAVVEDKVKLIVDVEGNLSLREKEDVAPTLVGEEYTI